MLHEKRRLTALRGLLLPVTAVLVLLCFLTALSNLAQGQDDEGKRGQVFVPLFGFTAACFASPVAWISADLFLIPAAILCIRHLRKL